MKWWCFFSLIGTSTDLVSVTLIITTYFSHLLTHLFQPFMDILSLYYTRCRRFALSLHPLLPSKLPRRGATVHLDSPTTQASTNRMRFPPSTGGHKELLVRSCECCTSYGCPHFSVLDLHPGPCQPQGLSHPRVHYYLYLPLLTARLLTSPTGIDWRPIPLPVIW